MESLESAELSFDKLLDFSLDVGEEDDDEEEENNKGPFHSKPTNNTQQHKQKTEFNILDSDENHLSFPELLEEEEEELEWLLNKDAFPSIETFDILSENASNNNGPKHQSPVSVLENSSSSSCSSLRFPVRARTKKRRRRRSCFSDLAVHQWGFWCEPKKKIKKKYVGEAATTRVRKCEHCLTEKTPQWRAGPLGPKTLCNACGVRYKSGRLVPEYRPASSPSFSSKLHSNSHRKILEMRRQKQKGMFQFQSLDKG